MCITKTNSSEKPGGGGRAGRQWVQWYEYYHMA